MPITKTLNFTLLQTVTTRKKMFDVALAATLKDHAITGLYTVNTSDFEGFEWLTVINPLTDEYMGRLAE